MGSEDQSQPLHRLEGRPAVVLAPRTISQCGRAQKHLEGRGAWPEEVTSTRKEPGEESELCKGRVRGSWTLRGVQGGPLDQFPLASTQGLGGLHPMHHLLWKGQYPQGQRG